MNCSSRVCLPFGYDFDLTHFWGDFWGFEWSVVEMLDMDSVLIEEIDSVCVLLYYSARVLAL